MSDDECYLHVLLALLDGRKTVPRQQSLPYVDNHSDMRYAYSTNRSYFDAYVKIVIALQANTRRHKNSKRGSRDLFP